jgi:hypothetical protein
MPSETELENSCPGPTKKYVPPAEEEAALIARGGAGLSEPLLLGPNLNGDNLVVQPLQKGETLIRVPVGRCRSAPAILKTATREIMLRMPEQNDVANYVPAFDKAGKRRMPVTDSEAEARTWGPQWSFVDTIIAFGHGNSPGPIVDFFGAFGLHRDGNPKPEQRIGIKPLQKKKGQGGQAWLRWKIVAADVPRERMSFALDVYRFALAWDGKQASFYIKSTRDQWEARGVSLGSITRAAEIVQSGKLRIVEWDMTRDVPGTLDPVSYATALQNQGYTIIEESLCGKNCVKAQSGPQYQIKAYNKVLETMQQGSVRGCPIDDKVHKLLNPSTLGLTKVTEDESYTSNGVTRLEATFYFGVGKDGSVLPGPPPSWSEMEHEMTKHLGLLQGSLVRCSIHEHIEGMGCFAKTTAVFYFPAVFDKKRSRYQQEHHHRKQDIATWLRDRPDALILRWINSWTQKMNGVVVNGLFHGRSVDSGAWDRTLLHIAACCTNGAHPVLFLCVGGWEALFDSNNPPLKHLYFRRVQLQRYSTGLSEPDTFFLSDAEPKRGWDALHVDVDSLTSLKPRVMQDHLFQRLVKDESKCSEVGADIAIEGAAPISALLDCDSARASEMGIFRGICLAKAENMPEVFTPVTRLLLGHIGKSKTERCRFQVRGAWFWVPAAAHEKLKCYVGQVGNAGNSGIKLQVRWGDRGLECTAEDDGAATMICSVAAEPPASPSLSLAEPTGRRLIGQPSACELIPVQEQPHAIKSVAFRRVKGTRLSAYLELGCGRYFYVPCSLTEQILVKMETEQGVSASDIRHDVQFDILNSFFLLRQSEHRIRVREQMNAEALMKIVDQNGLDVIVPNETAASLRKRGLEPPPRPAKLRKGGLEPPARPAKRQRTSV